MRSIFLIGVAALAFSAPRAESQVAGAVAQGLDVAEASSGEAYGCRPSADGTLEICAIRGRPVGLHGIFPKYAEGKPSSLLRRHIYIVDPSAPVRPDRAGVHAVDGKRSLEYRGLGEVRAVEPILAWHARGLVYDAFGDRLVTVGVRKAEDLAAGSTASLSDSSWRAIEAEATVARTSVVYMVRAIRPDGSIWQADLLPILAAIREELGSSAEMEGEGDPAEE
ncbi:MAG: hypothetical protein AAGN46_04580 [Acidobacteriota bacterium]